MREWYREKEAKAGRARPEVEVSACFLPLLNWVLSWWLAEGRRLALAKDPSSLQDLPVTHVARRLHKGRTGQPRSLSCFRRGIAVILAALINHQPLPLGRFYPVPWPT